MTTTQPTPHGEFSGAQAFRGALLAFFEAATADGAVEIALADVDFADWPLDDERLLGALLGWARPPGRRLLMLAARFGELQRRCPRFVEWRRLFSHVVDARSPGDETTPIAVPTLALCARLGLACEPRDEARQLRRGRWLTAAQCRAERRDLDVVLQQSTPAFPAYTAGL